MRYDPIFGDISYDLTNRKALDGSEANSDSGTFG
jgi:hypothetical protein